ncbi:hypothetical protein B0H17DRAFT_387336 [Mycena rosella]|uniref:Uncharacterized protein n=1 Tax=Mycena rosella TaxID=1033263 RepID=A0AAD7CMY3_MYCRO|nr:hypothetical protein B0H17DRAFT_387336 [Mycena rosella]
MCESEEHGTSGTLWHNILRPGRCYPHVRLPLHHILIFPPILPLSFPHAVLIFLYPLFPPHFYPCLAPFTRPSLPFLSLLLLRSASTSPIRTCCWVDGCNAFSDVGVGASRTDSSCVEATWCLRQARSCRVPAPARLDRRAPCTSLFCGAVARASSSSSSSFLLRAGLCIGIPILGLVLCSAQARGLAMDLSSPLPSLSVSVRGCGRSAVASSATWRARAVSDARSVRGRGCGATASGGRHRYQRASVLVFVCTPRYNPVVVAVVACARILVSVSLNIEAVLADVYGAHWVVPLRGACLWRGVFGSVSYFPCPCALSSSGGRVGRSWSLSRVGACPWARVFMPLWSVSRAVWVHTRVALEVRVEWLSLSFTALSTQCPLRRPDSSVGASSCGCSGVRCLSVAVSHK